MIADPYAPPQAVLERPRSDPPMPGGIRRQIRIGVVAAMASGALLLLGALRGIGGSVPPVYVAYNFSAGVVVLGLGYGVSRGGRTCAVLLTTFVLARALLFIVAGTPFGWPIALIVLACYGCGIIGTFRWHAFRDAHRRAAAFS